jgi:hypothetical protein
MAKPSRTASCGCTTSSRGVGPGEAVCTSQGCCGATTAASQAAAPDRRGDRRRLRISGRPIEAIGTGSERSDQRSVAYRASHSRWLQAADVKPEALPAHPGIEVGRAGVVVAQLEDLREVIIEARRVLVPLQLDSRIRKAAQRRRLSKGAWVRRALERRCARGSARGSPRRTRGETRRAQRTDGRHQEDALGDRRRAPPMVFIDSNVRCTWRVESTGTGEPVRRFLDHVRGSGRRLHEHESASGDSLPLQRAAPTRSRPAGVPTSSPKAARQACFDRLPPLPLASPNT